MKKVITLLTAMASIIGVNTYAAETDNEGTPDHPLKVKVDFDTRFDFDRKIYDEGPTESGFYGRYLNLHLNGQINEQLSFSMRHRLNKFGEWKNDVFGATDWIYLNYSPNADWTFSGGKQVVAIGGYEYDRNPINVYYASMFWNNIACFQFGVSATYHFDGGRQNITAQIANSPYGKIGDNLYSYNIMWTGRIGCFSSLWSVNLMQYEKNRYGKFISLGSRFDFDRFYTEIDLMNRYWNTGSFFGDYSAIMKLCANFGQFDVFTKGGYEQYSSVPGSGVTVDRPYIGAGLEFFPLKGSRDLRLHIVGDITHNGTTKERCTEFGAGLMWRINLVNKQ